MNDLKTLIREVPDFPKPGINLLRHHHAAERRRGPEGGHRYASSHYSGKGIKTVAGIEARGFIFAPAIAYALKAGFVPIRKPKKLPAATERVEYALEYGTDAVEIHRDAVAPGDSVLIVDDVLATGGTAAATAKLIEKLGGKVAGLGFVIELDFLNGRTKLAGHDVYSLINY